MDVKLLRDDSMLAQYVAAFYWSIMTMTTVGFGDIAAITTNERLFATFAMVNGAAIFSTLKHFNIFTPHFANIK